MKKKSEQQNEAQTDESVQTPGTKVKKKWNSADMVLVGGLLAIMVGMFWVMSGSGQTESTKSTKVADVTKDTAKAVPKTPFYEESKVLTPTKTTSQKSNKIVEEVEETPPFVYTNKADFSNENLMPPPEAYEQNNTLLAKKNLSTEEPSVPAADPKMSEQKVEVIKKPSTPKPQQIVQKPVAIDTPSVSYVCKIIDTYRDMLGKEIMYYTKDKEKHNYLPAHAQKNWDESGVWVKEKLIASQVDVDERMVEVSKGKWIPALEFMTCTIIQEGGR